MHGPGTDTELLDLRRALRDLVAISMLPGAWSGTTPDAVAYSLAQVLLRTLDLEFVYMQLQRPGVSAPLGTVATRATPTDATKAAQVADALVPLLESAPCGSVPAIPNPLGSGTVQLIASPIGFDARSGVVVAASPRSDFPTEQERTILTVAVNQAFSVLESKWAIETREQIVRREQDARGEAETAQARYRDLVNSLDAIVWEADAKTLRFSFVSRRAEDVLGYPVERWLTEPHFWAEHLHPDDRAWAVDFCVQCIAAKENHQFEYRILAADGRIVWLRNILNVVLDEAGEPTLLRGVMLDRSKPRTRAPGSPLSSSRQRMPSPAKTSTASSPVGIAEQNDSSATRPPKRSASRSRCSFPMSGPMKSRAFWRASAAASASNITKPSVAARTAHCWTSR
jgi:PAS domain S-box-containing protein